MNLQIIEMLVALIAQYAPDLETIATDLKRAFELQISSVELTDEENEKINAALKAAGDKIEDDAVAQGVTE